MKVASRANIFNALDLSPRRVSYNRYAEGLFKKGIKQAGGQLICVIHPLYLMRKISSPKSITRHPVLQQKIRPENYIKYLTRLGEFVSGMNIPKFVFSAEREREDVLDWLEELEISSPVAMIATEDDRPDPVVPGEKDPWDFMLQLAHDLKVNYPLIIGETGYQESDEWMGCVYDARLALLPLKPQVIDELTFPNVWAPKMRW